MGPHRIPARVKWAAHPMHYAGIEIFFLDIGQFFDIHVYEKLVSPLGQGVLRGGNGKRVRAMCWRLGQILGDFCSGQVGARAA
jgi:hypothetical protein